MVSLCCSFALSITLSLTSLICTVVRYKSSCEACVHSFHFASYIMSSASSALSCVNNLSQGIIYQGFSIECGVDYFQNDLFNVPSVSFEDCISSCRSTTSCVDVSFVPDQQTCYLKSASSNERDDSGVWTAKLVSTVNCPAGDGLVYDGFTISCGVDYYGSDLQNIQTDTFADCIDSCSSTDGCVDVSYLGTTCYMKDALTQSTSNDNVWTATKQGVTSEATTATPSDTGLTCAAGDTTKTYTTAKGTYDVHCNVSLGHSRISLNPNSSRWITMVATSTTSRHLPSSSALPLVKQLMDASTSRISGIRVI